MKTMSLIDRAFAKVRKLERSANFSSYSSVGDFQLRKALDNAITRGAKANIGFSADATESLLMFALGVCSREPAGMRPGFLATLFIELMAGRVIVSADYVAAITHDRPLRGGKQSLLGFADTCADRSMRSWAECATSKGLSSQVFLANHSEVLGYEHAVDIYEAIARANKGKVSVCAPAFDIAAITAKPDKLGLIISDQTMERISATGSFLCFDTYQFYELTGWRLCDYFGRPEFSLYHAQAFQRYREGTLRGMMISAEQALIGRKAIAFARGYEFDGDSFSVDYEIDGISVDVSAAIEGGGGVGVPIKVAVRIANHVLALQEKRLGLSAQHYSRKNRFLRVRPINWPEGLPPEHAERLAETIAYSSLFASINYAVRHRSFQAVASENPPYRELRAGQKGKEQLLSDRKLKGVEWQEIQYKIYTQHKWRCNVEAIDFSNAINERPSAAYPLPRWSSLGYTQMVEGVIDPSSARKAWGLGARRVTSDFASKGSA